MPLLEFSEKGLYCPPGDFYIDPWRPVHRAIITHAHSDHARWGHQLYLAHTHTIPFLKLRLGDITCQGIRWGEIISVNGIKISLHPAGHMIGSSQVRIEHRGEVWVVSGDYKVEDDGLSGSFEPVRCHTFITESTFGLPVYNWKPQQEIYREMRDWITFNKQLGRSSVILAYSLGKAQRILTPVSEVPGSVFVHGAIWNAHEILRQNGWLLPRVQRVLPETPKDEFENAVVIAPPGTENSPWIRRFGDFSLGVCSGWMQVRGHYRRRNVDKGFALSDHADWKGLNAAIRNTGAEKVYVTHGFQSAFSRYLNETGIPSYEVKTEFGEEPGEGQPAGEPSDQNNQEKGVA